MSHMCSRFIFFRRRSGSMGYSWTRAPKGHQRAPNGSMQAPLTLHYSVTTLSLFGSLEISSCNSGLARKWGRSASRRWEHVSRPCVLWMASASYGSFGPRSSAGSLFPGCSSSENLLTSAWNTSREMEMSIRRHLNTNNAGLRIAYQQNHPSSVGV